MLVLQNVCKKYVSEREVVAVNDVSFEIEKAKFLAIVGRSGSGKSTLLGMIGGISRPTSGAVLMDGCDQWRLKDDAHSDFRNRKIGFVFQFASLLPTLRAIDNVALPGIVGGSLSQKEAYARARAMLERVGLAERVDFYPGQLSGGEQRRVAIARALVNSPDLLLADEPTADLDEETESSILSLLVDIQKAFGLTLVVVTHNMDIAARADQVLEMRSGKASNLQFQRPMFDSINALPEIRELASVAGSNSLSFAPGAGGSARGGGGYANNFSGDSPATTGILSEMTTYSGLPIHIDSGGHDGLKDGLTETPGAELDGDGIKALYAPPETLIAAERIKLGEGLERFLGKLVLLIIPLLLLIYGANYCVASYQDKLLEDQAKEQSALEDLALGGLAADIKDVKIGQNKSYVLSLYLRNKTEDNQPLYVMTPVVRAFVQVGLTWQEVTLKPENKNMPQVLQVTGEQVYNYSFDPDVPNFTQLLPHYMHVRFTNDMLISGSPEPKHDLFERNDSYYVYLKPQVVKDADILSKMHFAGGKAPLWIPMPPH